MKLPLCASFSYKSWLFWLLPAFTISYSLHGYLLHNHIVVCRASKMSWLYVWGYFILKAKAFVVDITQRDNVTLLTKGNCWQKTWLTSGGGRLTDNWGWLGNRFCCPALLGKNSLECILHVHICCINNTANNNNSVLYLYMVYHTAFVNPSLWSHINSSCARELARHKARDKSYSFPVLAV